VEHHAAFHAQLPGQPLERIAVAFALVQAHVRVGGAEHHVDQVRIAPEHLRQGPDDVLDALVRGKQAERQQNGLALQAELVFEKIRVDERHVGNSVRNEIDLFLGNSVNIAGEFHPPPRHHHHPVAQLRDLLEHPPLVFVRLPEHGVEGGHHRHAQLAQHRQDVASRRSPEDAVLVLHADKIHVVDVEEIRRAQVGGDLVLLQLEADALRVVVALGPVVDRDGDDRQVRRDAGKRLAQVRGEGGDAALPRQVIADHGDLAQRNRRRRQCQRGRGLGGRRHADLLPVVQSPEARPSRTAAVRRRFPASRKTEGRPCPGRLRRRAA